MIVYRLATVLCFALILSCNPEPSSYEGNHSMAKHDKSDATALFQLVSPSKSGITFRNDITESAEVNGLTWDAIYSGGGVGIGDINNDGLDDIVLAGNQVRDALYLNKGNLEFENISESSGINVQPGWTGGVSMVDINADGFLDIYLCRNSWKPDNEDPQFRKNKLFINNGDLTFSEKIKGIRIGLRWIFNTGRIFRF